MSAMERENSVSKPRVHLSITRSANFEVVSDADSLNTAVQAGAGYFENDKLLKPGGIELMNLPQGANIELRVQHRDRATGRKTLLLHGIIPLSAIHPAFFVRGADGTQNAEPQSWESWMGLLPGATPIRGLDADPPERLFQRCLDLLQTTQPMLFIQLQFLPPGVSAADATKARSAQLGEATGRGMAVTPIMSPGGPWKPPIPSPANLQLQQHLQQLQAGAYPTSVNPQTLWLRGSNSESNTDLDAPRRAQLATRESAPRPTSSTHESQMAKLVEGPPIAAAAGNLPPRHSLQIGQFNSGHRNGAGGRQWPGVSASLRRPSDADSGLPRTQAHGVQLRSITPTKWSGEQGHAACSTPGHGGGGTASVPAPPAEGSLTGIPPKHTASFGALAATAVAEVENMKSDSRLINKVAANVKQIADLQRQIKELQQEKVKMQEQEAQRNASLQKLLDEATPYVQSAQSQGEDSNEPTLEARLSAVVTALKQASGKVSKQAAEAPATADPLSIHIPDVNDPTDCLLAAKLLRLDATSSLSGLSVMRLEPSLYRFSSQRRAGQPDAEGLSVTARCHTMDGCLLVSEESGAKAERPLDLTTFLVEQGHMPASAA